MPEQQRDVTWTFDELVLATSMTFLNGWKSIPPSDPRVQSLSTLLQLGSPVPIGKRTSKFRNANGVSRKTVDISTNLPGYTGKPTKGGKLDRKVIDQFLANPTAMCRVAEEIEASMKMLSASEVANTWQEFIEFDDYVGMEGASIEVAYRRRERDPRLRKKRIDAALASASPLACEVCDLDFYTIYGFLSNPTSMIDVHHVVPLHVSGDTKTSLGDLAIVCPTCHRAIHRTHPFSTPDELRATIEFHRTM